MLLQDLDLPVVNKNWCFSLADQRREELSDAVAALWSRAVETLPRHARRRGAQLLWMLEAFLQIFSLEAPRELTPSSLPSFELRIRQLRAALWHPKFYFGAGRSQRGLEDALLRIMSALPELVGGKEAFRYLPCSQVDLLELWNFIKTARRSQVNRTIGAHADHGYVFINERTGAPLRANTLTQEIRDLAGHAGIEDRVSPHMFRHRFITKLFVALIQEYDAHSPTELRRALVGLKEVQQRLQEWTGHLARASLERYIDLAFAEVENVKVSLEHTSLKAELEALKLAVLRRADEMSADGDSKSAHELIELVAACRRPPTKPSND